VLSWNNAEKIRLPESIGGPEWIWWLGILVIAMIAFLSLPKSSKAND
jgi:hypothetical protein